MIDNNFGNSFFCKISGNEEMFPTVFLPVAKILSQKPLKEKMLKVIKKYVKEF